MTTHSNAFEKGAAALGKVADLVKRGDDLTQKISEMVQQGDARAQQAQRSLDRAIETMVQRAQSLSDEMSRLNGEADRVFSELLVGASKSAKTLGESMERARLEFVNSSQQTVKLEQAELQKRTAQLLEALGQVRIEADTCVASLRKEGAELRSIVVDIKTLVVEETRHRSELARRMNELEGSLREFSSQLKRDLAATRKIGRIAIVCLVAALIAVTYMLVRG